jgi:hypothetical protein
MTHGENGSNGTELQMDGVGQIAYIAGFQHDIASVVPAHRHLRHSVSVLQPDLGRCNCIRCDTFVHCLQKQEVTLRSQPTMTCIRNGNQRGP